VIGDPDFPDQGPSYLQARFVIPTLVVVICAVLGSLLPDRTNRCESTDGPQFLCYIERTQT
jgi:hypothetical protein